MNKEYMDLIIFLNSSLLERNDPEQYQNIKNSIITQQLQRANENKDLLYLYYEIKSVKGNQDKTFNIMKKMQELGVNSLNTLNEMDIDDLIKCELSDYQYCSKLNPQLQILIYEKMMNENIDDTIVKLKQYKILTLDQFFSEDETLLLKRISIPKYQYRICKRDYINQQPNFKPLDQILREEKIQKYIQENTENTLINGKKNQSYQFYGAQYSNSLYTQQQQFIRIKNGLNVFQQPILQKYQISNIQDYKTIVFIGQTGAGKTTLMNYFLNFYLDVKFEDDFRYQLAEPVETNNINTYYLQPQNQKYGLRIVDTQGIGLTNETAINQKISDYLTKEIDQITAICYVCKSTTTRLDATENYVLDFIMQTFGLRFAKNCFFALTFCDLANSQAIVTLQTKGDGQNKASPVSGLISLIPFPWYFQFNCSYLFASNKVDSDNSIEDEDVNFNKQQWESAMKNFQEFYEKKLISNQNISFQKLTNTNPTILLSWLNLKKNLYILFNKLSLIKSDYYQLNSSKQAFKFREYSFQKSNNANNNNIGISIFCKQCKTVCLYHPSQKDTLETIISQYDGKNNYGTCLCGCLLTQHTQENSIFEITEKETLYTNKGFKASQDQLCINYIDVLLLSYKIQSILMQLQKQLKFNQEIKIGILTFETFLDYLINTEKNQINDGTNKNIIDILEQRKQDWKWLSTIQNPFQQKKDQLSSSLQTKWASRQLS